jgi:hypothetical protein
MLSREDRMPIRELFAQHGHLGEQLTLNVRLASDTAPPGQPPGMAP